MKYILIILLVGGLVTGLYYFYKRYINNRFNKYKEKCKVNLSNKANDDVNIIPIQVEQLPIESIEKPELLSEITDNKLLAHVNNLIPNLMQTGISANNVVKSTSDVVYQAIIPAGATLTNSKSMNGAVRGIYHGNKGIQGQANFVAVNQSSQVIANSVSTGINITSMIVGQYYMAQINSELAKINDEILKISNFQDTEYKSKILALLIQIKRISTFQTEILENKRLRDSDIDKLNALEQTCIELLGQANLMIKEHIKREDLDYKEYNQALKEVQNWYNYQKMLIEILYKITELKNILYLGTISEEQLNVVLNTYTKQVTDVRNSLVSWHENVTKKLGIDLETARRKRKGLDGAIHWIPGLFKDDFNFSTLSEQTKAMIEEQTLNYDLNAKFSISDSFNKDVKLISKDGKLYYLP